MSPPVSEPTAAKMQILSQLHYEGEVVTALELLRETSLSTIMVEQAHGSGAQLMARHPQVGPEVMTARMTVHNSRVLFAPSHFEKHEQKFLTRIAELTQFIKNADSHTTARCAYLKMMIAHFKAQRWSGGPSHVAIRKAVFQKHAECFASLTHEQQQVCEKEAVTIKRRKIDEFLLDRKYVQGQLDLLRRRHVESMAAEGVANHLDCQRFQPGDFALFAEKWAAYGRDDYVGRLKPPPAPIPEVVETLLQKRMLVHTAPSAPPVPWLTAVVEHRDCFQGCGLYPVVAIAWV